MEGRIAKWYATNTGKARSEFADLARRVAAQLPADTKVLDVAPGPGYFCIELARLGNYAITGIDISHTFVEIAQRNAGEAGVAIDYRQGSASHMPFAADTFDFLLCRAAFKNFGEPVRALQEMWRVLKPGGRALIIDLRKDAPLAEVYRHVDSMHLDAWNRLVTRLTFRFMLLKSAYTRAQFEHMLAQSRFRTVDIHEDGIGFEIRLTK